MKNRTPKQCRDRYKNYLSPFVFHGQWTNEEDEIVIRKFKEIGPKWSKIKRFLPNRSSSSIRNRWCYFLHPNKKDCVETNERKERSSCVDIVDYQKNEVDEFEFEYPFDDDNYNWFTFSDTELI